MRFRTRTFRKRRYRKRRIKRGKGLPYIKNNKVYYGQGAVSNVVGSIIAKLGDSLLGI